jgi:hypothetical protein
MNGGRFWPPISLLGLFSDSCSTSGTRSLGPSNRRSSSIFASRPCGSSGSARSRVRNPSPMARRISLFWSVSMRITQRPLVPVWLEIPPESDFAAFASSTRSFEQRLRTGPLPIRHAAPFRGERRSRSRNPCRMFSFPSECPGSPHHWYRPHRKPSNAAGPAVGGLRGSKPVFVVRVRRDNLAGCRFTPQSTDERAFLCGEAANVR